MTRPSDPDCPYCHGAGEVIVSRDPDIDQPCVCTDDLALPPGRWKLACLAQPVPYPKAVVYLLIDGEAHVERFFSTWAEAIAWLDSRPSRFLLTAAVKLAEHKREYLRDRELGYV